MLDKIRKRILKTEDTDISELEPFQGSFKTLSEENYNKLRKLILEEGFSFAVHVWENGGVKYIIDGHQRIAVLINMREQGYEVPKIPCVYVSAKNYSGAKKLVNMAVSQYGKISTEGFLEFNAGEEFDFNDFDYPDFVLPNLDDENKSQTEITGAKELSEEDFNEFDHECPKCGFEFNTKI